MKKKIDKKILIISAGLILLATGFSYAVYAAGIVFFGGSLAQTVVSFTTVGTTSWTVPVGVTAVEVLTVAGGGGGGSSGAGGGGGGGGGAGGLVYSASVSVVEGENITIVVGAGGAPGVSGLSQDGSDGGNSSFGSVVAIGGGGGAKQYGGAGHSGGSGGGGGYNGYSVIKYGGSGTSGQGNNGGNTSQLSWAGGAGGGGAGGVGGDNKINHAGGDRGPGLTFSITGSPVVYAIGGGGGANSPVSSPANIGKGGDAAYAAGTAYAGGSGIVVIKYRPMTRANSSQSGLVGHWPLDGDHYNASTGRVTDKTPYEKHGQNYGATLTTDRMGQSNGAMIFNGVNNYIDTNFDLSWLISDSFSMSAWVKNTTQNSHLNSMVSKMNYEYTFYTRSNTIGFNYWNSVGADTITMAATVADITQWHLATVTYNGSAGKLYIDGILVATDSSCSGVLANKSESMKIGEGYSWGTPSGYLDGQISDVRIYNRALSADEVMTLYGAYKPKITAGSLQQGLVFDMPLTSNYTKTVTAGSQIMTDRTPYSNNGQNSGGNVSNDYTDFVEESDVVTVPGAFLNNLSQITESAWINPNVLCEGSRSDWDIFLSRSDPWGYMGFYRSGVDFRASFYLLLSNGSKRVSAPVNISTNQWYHVVGVYDGIKMKIYINGVEGNSLDASGVTATTGEFLTIGDYNAGYHSVSPNAKMSSVKIYNRALSATEVKLLYDRGR